MEYDMKDPEYRGMYQQYYYWDRKFKFNMQGIIYHALPTLDWIQIPAPISNLLSSWLPSGRPLYFRKRSFALNVLRRI